MTKQFFITNSYKLEKLFLCVEASLALFLAKIRIKIFSFSWWSKDCGFFQSETLMLSFEKQKKAKRLAQSVRRMARYLPWKSCCLDQALAVQRMLVRRKLDNTIYFGILKNEEKNLIAHAWVRCGTEWVIGYCPETSYTVVGQYAKFFNI